jgi:hypothetical protein
LAYRSAKKRKFGEVKSTSLRKLIEAALMASVCFLAFARNNLKYAIATEPFSYLIILCVLLAYLAINVIPKKNLAAPQKTAGS